MMLNKVLIFLISIVLLAIVCYGTRIALDLIGLGGSIVILAYLIIGIIWFILLLRYLKINVEP